MKPRSLCLLALALLAASSAHAASLDDLLKQVQESSQQSSDANRQREARFVAQKNRQAELLAEAQAQLAQAEGQVGGVKARYDANQKEITELKAALAARSGEYTQVFAAARQSASDIAPLLAQSYINAQFPKRMALVNSIAKSPAQPSINQLESYWYNLQQELTEQGKSRRFTAPVVDPQGKPSNAEVTRIGTFTAIANGDFLAIPEGGGQLRALSRQPGSNDREQALAFAEAKDGNVPVLIDPSRGALLALQVERPDLGERIHQGGWPGYVIIAVGALGTLVALYQLLFLLWVDHGVKRQLGDPLQPVSNNPLGRVLNVFKGDNETHDPEILELRLSEAILRETPAIERFQPFLRLVIAAGPLLGLLGTVSGMIETFQVITEAGAGDPKLMAGGISQAMIATVLGLGIAIPLLFINAFLSSRSRALVQILDEQSAGLLARRLEAQAAHA